ncbi:MAG: polysaccharide deacetylase family protein [Caulobacterales bacterium]
MNSAYAPSRNLSAKIIRRMTQWRAARPIDIALTRPLLSITFDDFPITAATNGATVLEEHGARGTFYASAGMEGQEGPCGRNFSRDDLTALDQRGHEIGCHGFAHDDAAQRPTQESIIDMEANAKALAAMGHTQPLTTHAYPYGETRFDLKMQLPNAIRAARGVLPGLNIGRSDCAQLRAYPFFGADAFESVRDALVDAARRKAWLVVFTHDVDLWPSPWGATPAALTALVRAAKALDFDILPMREAANIAMQVSEPCSA